MERTRKYTGNQGERLAEKLLLGKGYRVVVRNWRCKQGEIDIICEDGDELVLVEVKTKVGESWGSPEEMVDEKKLERVRCASWYFDTEVSRKRRIDVVAVVLSGKGEVIRCDHYVAVG